MSRVMRHEPMTRSQSPPDPGPSSSSPHFARCQQTPNEGSKKSGVLIGKSLIRHRTRHDSRHHDQGSQQTETDGVQAHIGPQGAPPPVQQVAASSVLPFDECLLVKVVVRSPVTFDVRKLARARRHQASVVDYQLARPPSRLQLLPTVVTMIMAGE